MEADEETTGGLAIAIDTIYGAAIGFEIITREDFEDQEIEDAKWGFYIDLLFIRITFTMYE